MPAKTPLARDKIDAPAACAVPFRPYCGGVETRTRNVSEYILQKPRDLDLDLDLGLGHTAYRRASVIDLCLHTKFH